MKIATRERVELFCGWLQQWDRNIDVAGGGASRRPGTA